MKEILNLISFMKESSEQSFTRDKRKVPYFRVAIPRSSG